MKRIFLIGNTALFTAKFKQELIRALAKEHELYCLTYDYDVSSKEQIYALGAVPLDHDLNHRGLNPLRDILATVRLRRIIKQFKPDIVFSLTVKPVIFGTIAARLAGVKRVVGMLEGLGHGFVVCPQGKTPLKTRIVKLVQIILYKIALPLADVLIFLNKDDKADLLDQHNIKVRDWTVLGATGVAPDIFRYSAAPEAPVSFAFVGRLLTAKGIFEYLQAARMVKTRYPEAIFHVFGDVDDKNPFAPKREDLMKRLHDGAVVYQGFVDNMHERLARISVFVLPSWREGFSASTQEAMATGRPVITTDSVGCRETVVDGVNGFLVPPHDPAALADRMRYFVENPEKINEMGKESRKIAEKQFDVHKINTVLVKQIVGYEKNNTGHADI